jgi:hypothetical protein
MNDNDIFKLVSGLTKIEKLSIYMDWYIDELVHNNRLTIQRNGLAFIGKIYADKEQILPILDCTIGYLSKKRYIHSFDEFIDERNYKIIDIGEDWKAQGWAERKLTQLHGIYYFIKYNNEWQKVQH